MTKKISELSAVGTIAESDVLALEQSASTGKITISEVGRYVNKESVMIIPYDNNCAINITENDPDTDDVTITFAGLILIVSPKLSKFHYLISATGAVNKTIVFDKSATDLVCYIKYSDMVATASAGALPVYYENWSSYSVLSNPDTIILAYKNNSQDQYTLNGVLIDFINNYKRQNPPPQTKNNLIFNQTTELDITVTENEGAGDQFTIVINGELLITSPFTGNYLKLESAGVKTFVFDKTTQSVLYIKISDMIGAGDGTVLPTYYASWGDYTDLRNDDVYILAVCNKGGQLRYASGDLIDFIMRQRAATKNELFGKYNKHAFVGAVLRLYAHIPFDQGSTEMVGGDTLTGLTSSNAYTVHSVNVTSGDWSTNDAAGYIVLTTASSYLSAPYTDEEELQVGGTTYAHRTSVAAYGGWQQINGDHKSVNVTDFCTTGTEYCTIPHAIGATDVVSLSATHDEGFSNYQFGCSVGLDESRMYARELTANLTTGAIESTVIDFSDLSNCTTSDNVWILGLFKTS